MDAEREIYPRLRPPHADTCYPRRMLHHLGSQRTYCGCRGPLPLTDVIDVVHIIALLPRSGAFDRAFASTASKHIPLLRRWGDAGDGVGYYGTVAEGCGNA